jgi:DUF4097 and DUF4098 domain-containing protein YvlB
MTKNISVNAYLVFCLCTLAVFSGCREYRAKYEKTEYAVVPVADAVELSIETGVGAITVTGADVVDCSVTAEITVKAETEEEARRLAEQVKIEAKVSGDKLRIKVSKPAALKKRPLEAKLKIVAPRQLKLDCSINVGSVSVSGMNDSIKVSGNVGSISCRQVNGDIAVTSNVSSVDVEYVNTARAACSIDITTNVGSIDLVAPPQWSAQVSASTNVGSVKTDRPIAVVGKVGKSINGTVGSGEGKVRLKTNVGSIHIR